MPNRFFEERTDESAVKAHIVDKYYRAWARIMAPRSRTNKIGYVDLFSGPGRYADGSASVPLLVLENAIHDPLLRDRLVAIFNDRDVNHSRTLKEEIAKLPGIKTLRYPPVISTEIVGQKIIDAFNGNLIPTLSFIDPWGYKGLSLRILNKFLRDWGCDCIFFFNYNRINMGLNNDFVKEHMAALFGEDRAAQLRTEMATLPPARRELLIVEKISEAMEEMGGNYVLPFCFRNAQGTRTSHYLFFVSKHILGYNIMKGIMGQESSKTEQNVPSFSYCAADRTMPVLFELARPLDDLETMLLAKFAGQTIAMKSIFNRHHVGRRFLEKNYKEALLSLEAKGKVQANPPATERRKDTFGDTVKVTFPARGRGNEQI